MEPGGSMSRPQGRLGNIIPVLVVPVESWNEFLPYPPAICPAYFNILDLITMRVKFLIIKFSPLRILIPLWLNKFVFLNVRDYISYLNSTNGISYCFIHFLKFSDS